MLSAEPSLDCSAVSSLRTLNVLVLDLKKLLGAKMSAQNLHKSFPTLPLTFYYRSYSVLTMNYILFKLDILTRSTAPLRKQHSRTLAFKRCLSFLQIAQLLHEYYFHYVTNLVHRHFFLCRLKPFCGDRCNQS